MPTYPGLFRAKAVKVTTTEVTALIPQVFGDVAVTITDFLGAPAAGMGWVFFQAGDADHPVWCSGLGGAGGGGTVSDVVWVDPSAPTDTNLELWWDTDDSLPLDTRYATTMTTGAITPAANWTATGGFANYVSRIDGIVVVELELVRQSTTSAAPPGIVATVPAGFRPAQLARGVGVVNTAPCAAQVTTGGDVNFYGGAAATAGQGIHFNISYRVA